MSKINIIYYIHINIHPWYFFINLVHPQLTEFPRGVRSVVLGEDLVVSCTAEGRPTPDIIWSRNNKPLTSLESMNILISSTGMRSELQITSFTHTNSGEYSCTASNGVGNDTQYFEVNIIGELYIYMLKS